MSTLCLFVKVLRQLSNGINESWIAMREWGKKVSRGDECPPTIFLHPEAQL